MKNTPNEPEALPWRAFYTNDDATVEMVQEIESGQVPPATITTRTGDVLTHRATIRAARGESPDDAMLRAVRSLAPEFLASVVEEAA